MKNFALDNRGATAIEYGLVVAMIAMVVLTAIGTLGSTLSSTLYTAIASAP
jgi:pilus assembly protein Flp/PilA